MISKKDLLNEMNISYGQLYRRKREGLIPDEWFIKQSVSTGQETYFRKDLIIPRIKKILELKDEYQLEDLKAFLNPDLNKREFNIRDLILIDEIDPIILKSFSIKKSIFNIYDVIIIYIFSINQDLIDYTRYINYDFNDKKYTDFCNNNAFWLNDFALYMALKNSFDGRAWNEWEVDLKKRKMTAINRAKETYIRKGYEDTWIAQRLKTIDEFIKLREENEEK